MATGIYNAVDDFAVSPQDVDSGPKLQQALDAIAAAGGGILVIPPGTYTTYQCLAIKPPGNIHIQAHGATIKRPVSNPGSLIGLVSPGDTPGYTGPSNIKISGGTWDSNAVPPNPPWGGNVFTFSHCSDILVEDLSIINTANDHAIEFNGVKGGQVDNCRFLGFHAITPDRQMSEAVQIDGAFVNVGSHPPYDETMCDDIKVTNCTMRPLGSSPTFGKLVGSHTTVQGKWHSNIRVTGNYVEQARHYAVSAFAWRNVVIDNNTFKDCNGAIRAYALPGATELDFNGAAMQNVIISNNVIDNSGLPNGSTDGVMTASIMVYGDKVEVPLQDVIIRGNIIRRFATPHGIFVKNVRNLVVADNSLKNRVSTTNGQILYIGYSTSVTVNGNNMSGYGTQGMVLSNLSRWTSTGNRV